MEISPILLVIAGPAGSGKTTLCERLCLSDQGFSRVVTTTTRPKRVGEVDGVHYHFFDPGKFRRFISRGEFLEWTRVHGSGPNKLYGTLRSSIVRPLVMGQNLVVNVDVNGVNAFRKCAEGNQLIRETLKTVFIRVDLETMRRRLIERGTESPEDIDARIATAQYELREAPKFDLVIRSSDQLADFSTLIGFISQIHHRNLQEVAS